MVAVEQRRQQALEDKLVIGLLAFIAFMVPFAIRKFVKVVEQLVAIPVSYNFTQASFVAIITEFLKESVIIVTYWAITIDFESNRSHLPLAKSQPQGCSLPSKLRKESLK